jgi:hypothetical protein
MTESSENTNIEERDLNNRPDKAATCSDDWFFPCLFEFGVDFECALGNQKKAACKKDKVFTAEFMRKDGPQGPCQTHRPLYAQQKQNAGNQSECQA